VTRERAGQQRPARLSAPALQEASHWLVDFRSFFIDSYERLDDLLEQHHPERQQP
jgi:hypothetical protein